MDALQADVDYATMEGLLFRLKGDGKRYSVMLTQDDGQRFRFSFNTTGGWQVIRMLFHKFINEGETSGRRRRGDARFIARDGDWRSVRREKESARRLHDGRHEWEQ